MSIIIPQQLYIFVINFAFRPSIFSKFSSNISFFGMVYLSKSISIRDISSTTYYQVLIKNWFIF